jgi:hypothetical protein
MGMDERQRDLGIEEQAPEPDEDAGDDEAAAGAGGEPPEQDGAPPGV